MYKKLEGMLNAEGKRLGVVVSRFNEIITGKLLEGALDCWRRHGGKEDDVTVVFVPGAWEIPPTAAKLAKSGKVDAVVCLGAVIRGATPHFEFVAAESAKGIAQASMQQTEVPTTSAGYFVLNSATNRLISFTRCWYSSAGAMFGL